MLARTSGGLLALSDQCPHRRAPLSAGRVDDGELTCAYHGWRFGPDGNCTRLPALGSGCRIPASARATAAWGVTERYGLIWLAPEEPIVPIIDLPEWQAPDRSQVDLEVATGRYGAALLLDNQLDLGHFAFLHAGTFGTSSAEEVPQVELARDRWSLAISSRIAITAANDRGARRGERPLEQYRTMEFRYRAPYSLQLRLDYPVMGGSTVIWFFVQPETEERASLYVTLSFAQPGGFDDSELAERVKFEQQILGEDLDLQARFADLGLPLDPGAEAPTRADKASIEYRRILRELVSFK